MEEVSTITVVLVLVRMIMMVLVVVIVRTIMMVVVVVMVRMITVLLVLVMVTENNHGAGGCGGDDHDGEDYKDDLGER